MITRRFLIAASLLAIAAAYFPAQPHAAGQSSPPLIVIVGPSVSAESIDLGVLRNVYEGYPTDFGGRRLIPFNYPTESPERARFDLRVLGMGADQVPRYWIDQRVRRGVQPPRSITTPELMLKVVASLPGAIGYVSLDPKRVPAPLKVLAVDGQPPQGSKYPL